MSGRNAGGPEIYERGLIANLAALDAENEYHIFCLNQAASAALQVDRPNFHYHVLEPRSRVLSMSLSLPFALRRTGISFMHAAYMPPPFSPVDYAFTLHCSSPFIHPEFFPPLIRARIKALTRRGMNTARHIICVSQNVLDLAADYYQVPRERMSVVHNGVGEHFRAIPDSDAQPFLDRYRIERPYMLFIGRYETRKNILRTIEAFDIFRREAAPDMKLVLAGAQSWAGSAVDRLIGQRGLRANIIEPGYISNADLPNIYSAAEVFVFPSLWEGFGIPVVEAMASGTPVLTSNLSSLPEVAADAALFVDPYSIDDIALGMEKLYRDEGLRHSLREKGLRRAADFSWRRTAEQTLDVYGRRF